MKLRKIFQLNKLREVKLFFSMFATENFNHAIDGDIFQDPLKKLMQT